MQYCMPERLKICITAIYFMLSIRSSESLVCFQCHGTSISDVTASCSETVNEEHARFVSMVGCDGGSCALTVLNHTSIGLRDFTRTCQQDCQNSCFDTPFGTRLCTYCCQSDKCNAVIPHFEEEKYENVSGASGSNIRRWMGDILSKNRHHSTGPSIKFHMRHEILKLMNEFLVETSKQSVSVSETHEEDRAPENFRSYIRTTSRGFNLIGISPGLRYKTATDELIVVMAHYDTFPGTPGVNDNGSGVTVLLELARLLRQSTCNRENTIVFVATDFQEHGIYRSSLQGENSAECIPYGTYVHNVGATRFVCDWLLPHLRNYQGKLSMAINLDTVMNVYESRKKGSLPKTFVNVLQSYKPYGRTFIKEAKKKPSPTNWWMVKASKYAYERVFNTSHGPKPNLRNPEFLYLQLDTEDQNLKLTEIKKLLHEDDCAPFHEVRTVNLPCMTISDTAKYRGYMKRCHHEDCDTVDELDDRRLESLVKLTETMLNEIRTLAKSDCLEVESPKSELETPALPQCDTPLIQKRRHQRDIFVSATCARRGTTFEMCPALGGGIWATIDGDTAWIPRKVKLGRAPLWFQVDFTERVNITAIALQGVRRKGYVRSYMVSYSDDERNWEWLVPDTAQWDDELRRVEFRGNSNSRGIAKQEVIPAITSRFVRIYPRWWRRRIAMRIQIYGCRNREE